MMTQSTARGAHAPGTAARRDGAPLGARAAAMPPPPGHRPDPSEPARGPRSGGTVLVIAQSAVLGLAGGAGERVVFATYAEVSRDLLARIAPDIVLSSVMTPLFDAIDLAERLHGAGYPGPYRALTPPLPDPALVRREVASCAPGLDFDLLLVDPAA